MPAMTLDRSSKTTITIALILFASFLSTSCGQGPDEYGPKVLDQARAWKTIIESDIQVAVQQAQMIASSLEAMKNIASPSREAANKLMVEALEKHPEFLALWTCWEPDAFDNLDVKYQNTLGYDQSGRFIPYCNRIGGKINVVPLNSNFGVVHSIYQAIITSGKDLISDPVKYHVQGEKRLKVVYAVPITIQGKTVGAAGIDLSLLEYFKPIITQVRVLDVAHGFLVDHKGVMIAHPSKWLNVGKPLEFFAFEPDVIKAVKNGREASQIKISKTTGAKNYYQFVPINIGSTETEWSLAISLSPDALNG